MLLRHYVESLPRGERGKFRKLLALAHGVSVSLVRKWECDPAPGDWTQERKRAEVRRHPADLASIEKTEKITGNQVTRFDLRPEVWTKEQTHE